MNANSSKIQWLDTLRTLATVGVIIIHVSSPLVNMTYGKNMPYWWLGNVVDSAVRFAVPVFLMLSGATLLGKDYNLSEFYKKRVLRVLIPFLFWILVYWIFRWTMLKTSQQPHNFHDVWQWACDLFMKEGVSKHFWYIYMILFIYLFVPFLGKGLRKLSNNLILFILIGWVILCFALRSITLSYYQWTDQYSYKFLGYFIYTGYLVLGFYLSKFPVSSVKIRISSAIVFILTIFIASVSTYFFSKNSHRLDLSIYGYLTLNTIIQSIAIFLLIRDFSFKNKLILQIQNTISDYSYGIYLVHIIVIGVFFRNGIYWSFSNPLISLPLLTIMVLGCSFGIIYVLRKIPLGKYVAG